VKFSPLLLENPLINNAAPEYLALGHFTRDVIPGGAILGGTCSYAALTALKLGLRTAAVTSYGPDLPPLDILEGVVIQNQAHFESTAFENIYFQGERFQKWHTSARSISLEGLPAAWLRSSIVHFAPVAQEVQPSQSAAFSGASLICATGQGWLRSKDHANNVTYSLHPDLDDWLPRFDVLVLSLADVAGDRSALDWMVRRAQLGVETIGPRGCLVYHQGQVIHIPVEEEPEVDPTGAGDIFAAAFFIRFRETADPVLSAQFANACASLSVRTMGLDGIPHLPEVEEHWVELYADREPG
jgi:sugar/nucleoside kinase (ribokinase family)